MLGSIYFPKARHHIGRICSASFERSEAPAQVLTRSSSALGDLACRRDAMSSGKQSRSWAPQQQARAPHCGEIGTATPRTRASSWGERRLTLVAVSPQPHMCPCRGSCSQRRRESPELVPLLSAAKRHLQVKEAEPSHIADLFPGRRCIFYVFEYIPFFCAR